jgi:hypothetical protein
MRMLRKVVAVEPIKADQSPCYPHRPENQVRLELECGHHKRVRVSSARYGKVRCEFCEEGE